MVLQRDPELEQFAREEGRRAFRDRDVAWLQAHTSTDPSVLTVGTDPGEVFRGYDAVVATMREVFETWPDGAPEPPRPEVEAYRVGDIGWSIAFGTFTMPDGTSFPSRSMTIYQRENDVWKVLHNVFSLGVPNELLVPGSPLAQQVIA
jgi:hypothetical protein